MRAGHPLAGVNPSLREILDYSLMQISCLPPRALKPFVDAPGASSTARHSLPVPAIDCPTIPLAIDTLLGSDAVVMASLGMVKRELSSRRVVPVFHESWMCSNWTFMKLRHRSISPAAKQFLAALRTANAASVAEDAVLEKRWRERLPPCAVPVDTGAPKRQGIGVVEGLHVSHGDQIGAP